MIIFAFAAKANTATDIALDHDAVELISGFEDVSSTDLTADLDSDLSTGLAVNAEEVPAVDQAPVAEEVPCDVYVYEYEYEVLIVTEEFIYYEYGSGYEIVVIC